METVELNRDRTRIRVTGLEDGATRTLTGRDHQQLHHKEDRAPVGGTFQATRGDSWTSPVELPNFARPLPPGRYRIEIEYQYSDDPGAVVRSNAVEVEVVPVEATRASLRWFGAAGARGELASIWAYHGKEGPHWMYQTANGHDPGAVLSAVDLGPVAPNEDTLVLLAHLNDIAYFHFERYAMWVDGPNLGWLAVQPHGALGAAAFVPHGLAGTPPTWLVDPPLHCLDGGLCAVVAGADSGGSPAFSLVRIDGNGDAQTRIYAQPAAATHACLGWHTWTGMPGGELWYAAGDAAETTRVLKMDLTSGAAGEGVDLPGSLLHLAANQWLGRGQVIAVTRESDALRLFRWPLGEAVATPEEMIAYAIDPEAGPEAELLDCDAIPDLDDHALLLAVGDRLVVQMRAGTVTLSPGEPGRTPPRPLRLIATADGELFAIVNAGPVGLQALSLGLHPAASRAH